jgi:hypothetical protein
VLEEESVDELRVRREVREPHSLTDYEMILMINMILVTNCRADGKLSVRDASITVRNDDPRYELQGRWEILGLDCERHRSIALNRARVFQKMEAWSWS